MCSLFSFRRSPEEVRNLFNYRAQPNFPPREHIHPTQPIAVVRAGQDGEPEFTLVRWGLVPTWAKELHPQPLINARTETVYEKAAFKNAIRRRRCLIPADGFYEWQDIGEPKKQAWFIHKPDHSLFAFGGIWEHWQAADGSELESAAILTAEPNALLANIHNRCPVVVAPENFTRWLSSEEQVQDLLHAPADNFWAMEKISSPRAKIKISEQLTKPPSAQTDLF